MKKIVIPSLIAKSQEELDNRIDNVKDLASLFQLDVMDGVFVPNRSLDFDFKLPELGKFEAHLMVKTPEPWVTSHLEKVDTVLIHFECCREIDSTLEFILEKRRAGIAINPETKLADIEGYLDKIDQVLIMTVNPGFYGSPFLPEMLDKVRELRNQKPQLDIEVDGSMNLETIKLANEAGANKFVSGSYLQNAENVKKAYNDIMDELE
jgi:ribulose-phosphate 3-epimerase